MPLHHYFLRLKKALLIWSEIIRAHLPGQRRLNILLSPSDWQETFERFGRYLPHRFTFSPLQSASLADYDLVVPLNIPDVLFLSDRRPLLAGQLLAHPSRQAVELCDDKAALSAFLISRGFAHLLPAEGPGLPLPFMLKKKVSCFGRECHILRTPEDLSRFSAQLVSPDYYTQELIQGRREYAIHIYFQYNRIIHQLGVQYLFSHPTPIKGPETPLQTDLYRCPFLTEWTQILSAIGFEGFCCINYKIQNNTPRLLEINPRLGGSLAPLFFTFLRHLPSPSLIPASPPSNPSNPSPTPRTFSPTRAA